MSRESADPKYGVKNAPVLPIPIIRPSFLDTTTWTPS